MARLSLPTVTLCAAASVNVTATLEALRSCLDQIDVAQCLFFTDSDATVSDSQIRVVPIGRLASGEDYSHFLLRRLVDHVRTSHCLVVQWDGFVLDAGQWDPNFLAFDYIGAPWPQFSDGYDVGNGGFSLRSRKLLEACLDPRFDGGHPEDVTICRTNRPMLERDHGIRFADRETAERFAFERTVPARPTVGFHGIFNMMKVLGPDPFWKIYSTLDDRSTAFVDYGLLMHHHGDAQHALQRRLRLTYDRLKGLFRL